MKTSVFINIILVSLALRQRVVLGLAGVPQQERDSQGRQSHHRKREPVKLKSKEGLICSSRPLVWLL